MECVICWKKYFWWLLWRVKNLRSTACKHLCKHYRKCDVIYRYLHNELIWCLLMVEYLQNNFIMKWTTHFINFTGWIPLRYGSTTTSPIIAHCQKNSDVKRRISHCDPQNLQYKAHPEFWPSHWRIFKTSLYYKMRLILQTKRYHESYCYWKWLCWANFCTFHGTFKFLRLIGSEDQRYGSNFLRIIAISLKFGRVMHSTM